MRLTRWIVLPLLLLSTAGCWKKGNNAGGYGGTSVQILLDWKPEPEFGGFYQAKHSGAFLKRGIDIDLKSAGEGAPTWQLLASGKADFATTAADQVLIARAQGADVVAVFAVYQTSPQGIMVHAARGFKNIKDVFTHPGTLAAEDNAWLQFCRNKYSPITVKLTGYAGGVQNFLADKNYSQQCFITSEPILARRQGGDPQTFLVADAGYNPYTTVLICRGQTLRDHPDLVKNVVDASREGWRDYLDDPSPANAVMEKLNSDMDPATFTEAAAEQHRLIETDETKAAGLGFMNAQRWDELAGQMTKLTGDGGKPLLAQKPKADECFENLP